MKSLMKAVMFAFVVVALSLGLLLHVHWPEEITGYKTRTKVVEKTVIIDRPVEVYNFVRTPSTHTTTLTETINEEMWDRQEALDRANLLIATR